VNRIDRRRQSLPDRHQGESFAVAEHPDPADRWLEAAAAKAFR
jgi:hypothetical protein